jgi:trans-2-enoyl-CoA reductase
MGQIVYKCVNQNWHLIVDYSLYKHQIMSLYIENIQLRDYIKIIEIHARLKQ